MRLSDKLANHRTAAILVGVVALLVAAICIAQEPVQKTKIAVMELKAERGLDKGLVKLLNELLLTEFENTGKFKVIGGSDLQSMLELEERKRGMDCQDVVCLSEMGGALGVDKLAVSNIGVIGAYYLVNVKIIDVRRSSVEARVSYKVKGIEDKLIKAITASVHKLVAGDSPAGLDESDGEIAASADTATEIGETMDPFDLWGHISFWGGVGVAAFGGVATALSASAASDYEGGDLAAEDRSRTWAALMYTGFGIGAAMMATGVVLWLLEPDYSEPSSRTGASAFPAPDGSGIVFTLGWEW
jgi:hypothetical protein